MFDILHKVYLNIKNILLKIIYFEHTKAFMHFISAVLVKKGFNKVNNKINLLVKYLFEKS